MKQNERNSVMLDMMPTMQLALKPGCKVWPTDVCVPISRLAECILETRADIDASNLTVPIVGHVGYGNFHLLFLIDSANEAEDLKQFQQLNDRLIERALKMGGLAPVNMVSG